jgi:uncharacterized protein YggE
MTRLPLAAALLLGTLALTACAAPATPAAPVPGITARGIGTVAATPDVVTVTLGVQNEAGSAAEALDANSRAATGVLDVLRGAGVDPADLRTSGLAVLPTYADDGRRITGYQVTNRVTAVLRDVAGAGALIDAAAGAAGDAIRVDGLTFSVDDDSAARAAARGDAVRRAVAQAAEMADAAGVSLGPIQSITEVPATTPPPQPYAADAAQAALAVPLEPGMQDVEVVVEVVHAIG